MIILSQNITRKKSKIDLLFHITTYRSFCIGIVYLKYRYSLKSKPEHNRKPFFCHFKSQKEPKLESIKISIKKPGTGTTKIVKISSPQRWLKLYEV